MAVTADSKGAGTDDRQMGAGLDWVDILATLVMAVAALLTAWSAFQSDQWGDRMSFSLAEASAARTEAAREYTRAGQLSEIDVASFFTWLEVTQAGVAAGTIDISSGYTLDPDTLSGLLHLRFRPEFRVAMDAWLNTSPLTNPDAPPTPFAMPEYEVAEEGEAERLETEADANYARAEAADANDDQYVISTILYAAVFLFAGLSTKMRSRLGQYLMLGFGVLLLLGTSSYVFTIPILV